MKGKRFKDKPACSEKSVPFPTEVTCPRCGSEIELWSDEEASDCGLCGYEVVKGEDVTY
jgi:ribosomal protein S27AE